MTGWQPSDRAGRAAPAGPPSLPVRPARVGLAVGRGVGGRRSWSTTTRATRPASASSSRCWFAIGWLAGFASRERAAQAEAGEERAIQAEREREAAARIAVAEELMGAEVVADWNALPRPAGRFVWCAQPEPSTRRRGVTARFCPHGGDPAAPGAAPMPNVCLHYLSCVPPTPASASSPPENPAEGCRSGWPPERSRSEERLERGRRDGSALLTAAVYVCSRAAHSRRRTPVCARA